MQPSEARPRFADEDLPEGSVVDGDAVSGPLVDEADFVVVGSGAAGGTAAYTLACAGYSVIVLEEGPYVKTRELVEEVHATFGRLFRSKGLQVLEGRAFMPMLQGRCVGGSTLVNSAIAWRVPEDVVDDWRASFGLGSITMKELDGHFDAIEHDLSVRSVAEDVLGENNRLFLDVARSRGIVAAPMRRYDRGCKGSALCLTGCQNGAKQGMSVTYVPWSLARGARLYSSCRVERVVLAGNRAVAVRAVAASGHVVEARARRGVLVAASTVQTPGLLRRSGVRSPALGRYFQAHPGLALGGLFDRPIEMAFGATQGCESIHFRKTDRFKLETISMPPELAAARVPGVGKALASRLARLGHVAVWAAQIRAEAQGTVGTGLLGGDVVRYTMTENDMRATRKAVAVIARLMFDGGAREVWPGIHGVPPVLTSPDQVALLEDGPLEPRSYSYIATHLFGAARMGPDPGTSVCAPDFSVHGTRGLYVVDSSVFPTNLGVNPQHSIMAMSRLACTRLANAERFAAVA